MHLPHFVKTSCGTPLPGRLVWRVAQPPEASPRRRVVRAKGMYNSLPKSIQSLGLLVISAGPFHCALARCVPNPAPLARLCRVRFHRRQSKKQNRHKVGLFFLVRAKGIEPSSSAWEADVLPLYHARDCLVHFIPRIHKSPAQKTSDFFGLLFIFFRPRIHLALN